MSTWIPVGVVSEGDALLVKGMNVWARKWKSVDAVPVELDHPAYPGQIHRFRLYEIENDGMNIQIAAAEVSANVWGFYVQA